MNKENESIEVIELSDTETPKKKTQHTGKVVGLSSQKVDFFF
jgi:hypothetical protein